MPRLRHHDEFGDVYRAFGERIAQERARRSLSQRELAELTGTTQSAIARLEGGSRAPRLDTLLRSRTRSTVSSSSNCGREQ